MDDFIKHNKGARMRRYLDLCITLLCTTWVITASAVEPPAPYGAVPSERQLKWHDLEFYGFAHFTLNTWTDKEWGYGDESPELFNPTAFDADQIVGTAKMAGMKGLILTCKHHDGFCLWPSAYTEHSVKNSPWKNGQGDAVREFSDACKRHGLKFGVYLSPWDRNYAEYGSPAYIEYFRNQLRELLTQYGPIFEVWWDGANGGDGYYGGARERREIDRRAYYGWAENISIVRQLQPDACIFSDAGPDVRWIGNEKGMAGDPCWATYNVGDAVPGVADKKSLNGGNRNGSHWIPGEADVSIRPGWFYHKSQDRKVRSPENLVNLYYASVGRGTSLLLNLPPDRRGLIPEKDVASLKAFRRILDKTFAVNLATQGDLQPSHVRGGAEAYGAARVLDGDRATYWTTDDDMTAAELVLTLPQPTTFNVVDIREYLPLGQRIDKWALDRWENGAWVEFARGQSIGNRRLWRGDRMSTSKVRLRVSGPVCPAISEFGLYAEPAGTSAPGKKPFMPEKAGRAKRAWKVVSVSGQAPKGGKAQHAIDGNPKTLWHTHAGGKELAPPQEIVVDLGKTIPVSGFSYLSRQDGTPNGIVDRYAFYLSVDGTTWGTPAAEGEFSNILNNPVMQTVDLAKPVRARYFKFVALHVVQGRHVTVAELGILGEE